MKPRSGSSPAKCDLKPIEYAVQRHEQWYVGDGTYGDGAEYHWDYYNSYVIQPMLLEVLRVCAEKKNPLGDLRPKILARARRYAVGAGTDDFAGGNVSRDRPFQRVSLRRIATAGGYFAPARTAAGIETRRRSLRAHRRHPPHDRGAGNVRRNGWLQVGAVGHQPSIRENYISTGSLYLCLCGLVQLGLPANDPFWTAPAEPWTQKKIWSGDGRSRRPCLQRQKMKTKLGLILTGLACALASMSNAAEKNPQATHTFAIGTNDFLLDGQRFQIRCGEIHAARVPMEYWRHRLQMAKAMGLNTVCAYLFWNLHEPKPGEYVWTGQADDAEFCRLAQEEGLWVILRPGPYACAEWEMGGTPWWLLKNDDIKLRTRDPRYLDAVKSYLKEVGRVLGPLQITHGGPIIMAQVENEYGFFGKDAGIHGRNPKSLDGRGF